MFSILHLSDLHRSIDEPVDNDSLLAALLADRDRYVGDVPHIPVPSAIVVTGDLIQGARINLSNWQQSMRDQYTVAGEFLASLCERFLNGDRSQIVLIPGNHDVCWNTSRNAMDKVPLTDYPSNLYKRLIEPDSLYRWSWSELALYKITDLAMYNARMDFYWNFTEEFYKNTNIKYRIDRGRGYQLFEICNRRIIVAAFDSIVGNDCFGYSGAIQRGAVGRCAMFLRDAGRSYDLKMAVWHHSTQGLPVRSDYMDPAQVQEMIGHGFQLGLHGHQHIAATQTQMVHLDEGRLMAVVSAGSLCAGANELPRGINRQYNIIVLDDNFLNGRIHVREMGEGDQFSRKRNGAFVEGFVDITWQPLTDRMGRRVDAQTENTRRAVIAAEAAVREGRPRDAVKELEAVDISTNAYARKILIDALLVTTDWTKLISILHVPASIEESVILITALMESGLLDDAEMKLDAMPGIDDGTRGDLRTRIHAKKLMRA